MLAVDFKYDGRNLSSFGFIICEFNDSYGVNTVDIGSKIIFNKASRNHGKHYSLVSTRYDRCIQSSFDICKNPEIYDYTDREITDNEYRNIVRWLNRREFLKFNIINHDNCERYCYYDASFNIAKVMVNERLYGLHLTMETNSPFGYGKEQTISHTFTDTTSSYTFVDLSDEIGVTYPHTTITCNADGDLQIKNDFDGCVTYIKNCKSGEVITIDGGTEIITTSYNSHDICNDFNYEFIKIGNTLSNRRNSISVSKPCKIELRYSPIIKDVP